MTQAARKLTDETNPADDALDPRAVREATGLSQQEMARLLRMGDYGYSAWERGVRTPGGPAHRLLALIASDPKRMVDALKDIAA